MDETFNVGNPTEKNITFAFKNLLFFVSASIQLEIYKEFKKNFEDVLNKINIILAIYVNNGKLSSINEQMLQDIKFDLIDLDVTTKNLKLYYAEWALLWIESIISLRISEIKSGGVKNGR